MLILLIVVLAIVVVAVAVFVVIYNGLVRLRKQLENFREACRENNISEQTFYRCR